MRKTIDGFPISNTISFLSDIPNPEINRWSYGKITKVEIVIKDYWYNLNAGQFRRTITWRGKTRVVEDYSWFQAMIKQWMTDKWYPLTKEQAISLWFDMEDRG